MCVYLIGGGGVGVGLVRVRVEGRHQRQSVPREHGRGQGRPRGGDADVADVHRRRRRGVALTYNAISEMIIDYTDRQTDRSGCDWARLRREWYLPIYQPTNQPTGDGDVEAARGAAAEEEGPLQLLLLLLRGGGGGELEGGRGGVG